MIHAQNWQNIVCAERYQCRLSDNQISQTFPVQGRQFFPFVEQNADGNKREAVGQAEQIETGASDRIVGVPHISDAWNEEIGEVGNGEHTAEQIEKMDVFFDWNLRD